jgi:hypothetical protein
LGGSFDLAPDGTCTTLEQSTTDNILNCKTVVLVTKHMARKVGMVGGLEQIWVGTPKGFQSLKLPSFTHKLSKGMARLHCIPLKEWMCGLHIPRDVPDDLIHWALSFVIGDIEDNVPLRGYGQAIRLGFVDHNRLPNFGYEQLVPFLELGPNVKVEDATHVMEMADPDKLVRVGLMDLPEPVVEFEKICTREDVASGETILIFIRNQRNSDAFLVMQSYRDALHKSATLRFAGNCVAVIGKGEHMLLARTPRTPIEMARVLNDSFGPEQRVCVVCLEQIAPGSSSLLPCGHSLHTSCYRKLFRHGFTKCSVCDKDFEIHAKDVSKLELTLRREERRRMGV